MSDSNTYIDRLAAQHYAYGEPTVSGKIKLQPEDFQVTEVLGFEPCGEGEHFWLDVSKTQLSSERVAKALARFSGVAYRDVGYSGMKDVQANTRQWFSVWMPKQPQFDWQPFAGEGITVHSVVKHNRKIKRGTHKQNKFVISVRDIDGELVQLAQRLEQIKGGVPNYFGVQRFGRDCSNLDRALAMFTQSLKIKDKNLKSITLSAARSFLFNQVVSARVADGTWKTLYQHEPAALEGSNATFISNEEPDNQLRLQQLDIHPTAPMWGAGAAQAQTEFPELSDYEQQIINVDHELALGLQNHNLKYQRRSLRCIPHDFEFQLHEQQIDLSFTLQSGQFATSVLRELVHFD